jgi:hypothetical protein
MTNQQAEARKRETTTRFLVKAAIFIVIIIILRLLEIAQRALFFRVSID